MLTFTVNGQAVSLDADLEKPLLWVLREDLSLTGTKYSCGIGNCGACTVLINGNPSRSCTLPVKEVVGKEIITIEGIADQGRLHLLQQAWIEEQAPQCGYCQSGMVLSAVSLLEKVPNPAPADIRKKITNICRCGTYPRIEKAILKAAAQQKQIRGSDAQ
jgi:isoquinoline 1-oxidoreductase alpha subunit